jgi:VCBS repeat-containing protein
MLRSSDDQGATWSPAVRVNDDPGQRNQFFPSIAVDQETGHVALGWHDARDDSAQPAVKTRFYATISGDGGQTFSPNVPLNIGLSDATVNTPGSFADNFQYGDYTGLVFTHGFLFATWADNSLELGSNPARPLFDQAVGRPGVARVANAPLTAAGQSLSVFRDRTFTGAVAAFQDENLYGRVEDFSATIDWGDGQASEGTIVSLSGGFFQVLGTHKYTGEGEFLVTVVIDDVGGTSVAAEGTALVLQKILATGSPLSAIAGKPVSHTVATFFDAEFNDDPGIYSATINWGDGSPPTLGTVSTDGVQFVVTGPHTYAVAGSYTVTVKIQDESGPSATVTSTATIAPPTLLVDEERTLAAFEDVTTGAVPLATFEIQGPVGTAAAYSATINWGDASPTTTGTLLILGNTIEVSGVHIYTSGGTFHPIVTLSKAGESVTATATIDVGTDVSSRVLAVASGVVYNPATLAFYADVTVTNISATPIDGPIIQIVLAGLPAGVQAINAAGFTGAGNPYLNKSIPKLNPGLSLTFEIVFSNPAFSDFEYGVTTYSDPPTWWIESQPGPFAPGVSTTAAITASPFSFETNQGQAAAEVEFVARGPGYVLYLAEQEVVLSLSAPTTAGPWAATAPAVLRMQWQGGNSAPVVSGQEQLAGVSNYLLGNDPSAWQTSISRYGRVKYDEVYDGIDLVYYGREGALEYDWVVAAGADPAQISFAFDGAEALSVDSQGNLVIQVAGGTVVQRAPVLYQDIHGVRHSVGGSYDLRANGQVGFSVGAYDPSRTLVIDPVLVYSTYLGGSGEDVGLDATVDAAGNSYVVGYTAALDFPTQSAGQPQHAGGAQSFYWDAFVTKLDPSGVPIYSTYLGGSDADRANGIAVDADGNAYIAGFTASANFPVGAALQPAFGGPGTFIFPEGDGFVTKLNAAGSALIYSTYLGGGNNDSIDDIALDATGAAYVTGLTQSSNFPIKNALQPQASSGANAFVTKISAAGAAIYSTYLGGNQFSAGTGIDVDSAGKASVTGFTSSSNWPLVNALQNGLLGPTDVFVTTLNADASAITFSSYLGGSGDDRGTAIAVDGAGNLFVIGTTFSADFPLQNPLQPTLLGTTDAFVTKISAAGTKVYSTYLGGSGDEGGNAIAVDSAGNAYIVGGTGSADFPIVRAVQSIHRGGDRDGFVTALNPTGSGLVYSTFLGGSGNDFVNGIGLDAAGNAAVVGFADSLDLRVLSATQGYFGGGFGPDAFVTRIDAQGSGILHVFNKPIQATEGSTFSGLVASFTDTGSDLPGDYSATIDWGDGQTSAGTISGNGFGNFDVFGDHLYADTGFYSARVTVFDSDGSTHRATTTAAGASLAGFRDYHVSLDTSALAGTIGSLSFQLNAGSAFAQGAEVRLSHFVTAGGSPLPGELLIDNSDALNRLTQAFTFGTGLSFDVRLSGAAISDPLVGLFGSRFAVQLLGADGLTPQLTTNPSGAVLTLDISAGGATRFTSYASGAEAAAHNNAYVQGAQLESAEVPIFVTEGVAFSEVISTFTSGNPLETSADFTAVIDWGDETAPSAGVIAPDGSGGFTVTCVHVYADVGQYRLKVIITDQDGGSTQTSSLPIRVGGLQAGQPTFVGNFAGQPLTADFNGDGLPDLVIPDQAAAGNSVAVVLGKGNGTFFAPVHYATGTAPLAATLGDFNGDGKLDIAVACVGTFQSPSGPYSGSRVDVLFGKGDGTFQAAVGQPTAPFTSLVSGDFNHDGQTDLVLGRSNNPVALNVVGVLLGQGNGTFQPEVFYTTPGINAAPLRAGDFNADGNLDVLVATGISSPASTVLLGNGNGTFRLGVTLPGLTYLGDDFNSDGQIDAVRVDPAAGTITILLGSGGTFSTGPTYSATGQNVAVGDFNSDSRPDLLLYDRGAPFNLPATGGTLGVMNVLLGAGDGTFGPPISYSSIARPGRVVLADFNQDGNLDVAAVDGINGGVVTVALGNGDGTLVSPNVFPSGGGPRFIRTADLNGDGHFDVVTANNNAGVLANVSVQLGNGDGTIQVPVKYLLPLTATPLQINAQEQWPFTGAVATFIDADPNSAVGDFSAIVNWGDGQTSSGAIAADGNGGFIVLGAHTYTTAGNYLVGVVIAAIGGNAANTLSTALVAATPNAAPAALDDYASGAEDVALTIDALANDSDLDLDALTPVVMSGPSHGSLSVNANGSFTYTPLANYHGTDSFTYRASDGSANSNVAIVTLVIEPVNDAPLAVANAYATSQGTILTVAASGVLSNDTDADGDPLTATLAATPAHGQVTLNPDGSFSYVPAAGYVGSDSFSYRAFDGEAVSGLATVNITVAPLNQSPLARTDRASTAQNTPVSINVLANDSDANGDALTAVLLGSVAHGTLTPLGNGAFLYTPATGFSGQDSFVYQASDGKSQSNTAQVTFTVIPASNQAPVAAADAFSTGEDTPLTVAASGVLANDTDVDGDPLTAVLVSGPAYGTLTLNPNGSFTYTPSANFHGSDSFTYLVNDGTTSSNVATVTLHVAAVNDVPVAANEVYSVVAGNLLTVPAAGVLTNDADVDGDALTAIRISGPLHGTLTLNPDGSFTYSPDAGFAGNDSFTYRAHDGTDISNIATVTLLVTPVNRPPVLGAVVSSRADCGCGPGDRSVMLSAPFTDADGLDTHTALIHWGDGTSSAATVTSLSGSGSIFGAHQYATGGLYTITVTLVDSAQASDSATAGAVISGIGVRDGVLYIIGTQGADHVTVNLSGGGSDDDDDDDDDHGTPSGRHFKVHASFLPARAGSDHDDDGDDDEDGHGTPSGRHFKVHASFLPARAGSDHDDDGDDDEDGHGAFQTFAADGITKIVVILCDGNDQATIAGNIETTVLIDGGAGNDKLKGGGGPDVLVGGPGNDQLTGGSGRDLLIGGLGADLLVGNSGEDILIAGVTAFDANYDALFAIMGEWSSSRSEAQRAANLRGNGSGPAFDQRRNGNYFLQADGPAATVFDDNAKDRLTGSAGRDWFFANLDSNVKDQLTDQNCGEWIDDLDLPV